MNNLLIVESPGKITKLKGILGSGWEVKASMGHIRELSNEGSYSLGFTMQNGSISCQYVPRDSKAKKTIAGLRSAAKQASNIYLASDPDREGETIAWHLAQVLSIKNPQRVVYSEITKSAVQSAVQSPRALNVDLVNAGRCRECLDKLVGYRGSPLVWKLNNGAKSVGRVQSAALHIVCERERAIKSFIPQDYWSVYVEYEEGFRSFYDGPGDTSELEEESIDDSGQTDSKQESSRILTQEEADRLVAIAQGQPHQVLSIEGKLSSKKPPSAFTTSALQQVAGSRIQFSPEQTMKVAQKLYEAGLITYMRTDSVQLSPEFCQDARDWLQANDPQNIPAQVAKQKNSGGAQEAHEAIRPTDLSRSIEQLKSTLSDDEFKLYVLIFMRALASQCKPAQIRKTVVVSESGNVRWKAKGQVLEFEGYTKYWRDLNGDKELPQLENGQALNLEKSAYEAKQTRPPARYTEPKLVQVMEKLGVGRPSTYAPTVKTLKQREYVVLSKKKLMPTERGMQVDDFLLKSLPDLLQPQFTAEMETQLDAIAQGRQNWEQYLSGWNRDYFEPALSNASANLPEIHVEKSDQGCPQCQQPMTVISSTKCKNGHYLRCETCKVDGRSLVMFWSEQNEAWELPGVSKKSEPGILTNIDCPACKGKLEIHTYKKDGETKKMLRCADPAKRRNTRHKNAVYFYTENGDWWSRKHGTIDSSELEISIDLSSVKSSAPTHLVLD